MFLLPSGHGVCATVHLASEVVLFLDITVIVMAWNFDDFFLSLGVYFYYRLGLCQYHNFTRYRLVDYKILALYK